MTYTDSCTGLCTRLSSLWETYAVHPAFYPTLVCGLIALYLLFYFHKCGSLRLYYASTTLNEFLAHNVPSFRKIYRPTFYLPFGLSQTICYGVCRKFAKKDCGVEYRRELVPLSDGGQVSLDWPVCPEADRNFKESTPILFLLPGTAGGRHDTYIAAMINDAAKRGYRSVMLNQRGLGGTPLLVCMLMQYSAIDAENVLCGCC